MRDLLLVLFLLYGQLASARVRLAPLFSDHMVLQQQTKAAVWGSASPRHGVRLVTSWDARVYTVKAGEDGRWSVLVDTPAAGGPYSFSVSDGGKPVTVSDVMIGEVWLCAGQSNMAMPMEGWTVKTNADVIAGASRYANVRLMRVDNAVSSVPSGDMPAQKSRWQQCSPETVAKFSATGFFFGRSLAESLNVPVGLVMSCWGGTSAESWTSPEALATMPEFRKAVYDVQHDSLTAAQHEALYQSQLVRWLDTAGRDEGSVDASGRVAWAVASYDDSGWTALPQPMLVDKVGCGNFDGIIWYRKTVDIPEAWSGYPVTLTLGAIDDFDVTYFNGEQVGHLENCPTIRRYTVPASMVKGGRAVIAVRVVDVGGAGGLRAKPENISMCCGKDTVALDGEWRMRLGADLLKLPPLPVNPVGNPFMPTVLFNAMIKPLVPFAMKGVVWYQGENNTPHAFRYRELLPLLINDWRGQWGRQMPFLIVQLANYMKRQPQPSESEWAELREAQLKTALSMDGTGLAVTIDVGDADDIHLTDKATVGSRLALVARDVAYHENVVSCGPLFSSYTIGNGEMRIRFSHVGKGLVARGPGRRLTGFAVAGVDRKFHWADARIEGDTVVVGSRDVPFPVAARYAWADNPECNLYNAEGLPAVPFRTDEWKGLTTDR